MLPIQALRFAAVLLAVAPAVAAAQPGGAVIDINAPKRSKYPLAVPPAAGGDNDTGRLVAEVAGFDMKVAGVFRVVDSSAYRGSIEAEGLGIDPGKWKDSGAFGVMKFKASGGSIEFKLYEVEKGERPVLQRTYRGSKEDARKFTHMWCNEVVKYYTGELGFFGSKIAFVTRTGRKSKAVMAMDFDGHGVYSVSKNKSINILPAWSPRGDKIAFSSYMRDNPDVYVVTGGGRPVRTSYRYGMNTGASWSPDGSKLAVTLSKDGNPEIYVIDSYSGKILRRLTNNRAIDSGPAWSPDGSQIAFVSDREGGPQIFVMNADGSGQKRVSMNGNYNTTPAWNPRKGTRQLAYTTRADKTFDIVTLDLSNGKYTRITQGEGVNEEPSWAPNGLAIAFASTRSGGAGVYIANSDGTGDAIRVWKGTGTSVDWGPAPSQ
jgi:TolB protein